MPWLDKQWQQAALNAMLQTFDVSPSLKNEIVQFLLDEGFWDKDKLNWDSAIARYNACLNPNKSEFFKLSEAWAISKRFGRPMFALAMVEDLGYESPRPMATESRRQQLLEQIHTAVNQCEATVALARAELARLAPEQLPDARIHPAIAEGRSTNFALAESEAPPSPGLF